MKRCQRLGLLKTATAKECTAAEKWELQLLCPRRSTADPFKNFNRTVAQPTDFFGNQQSTYSDPFENFNMTVAQPTDFFGMSTYTNNNLFTPSEDAYEKERRRRLAVEADADGEERENRFRLTNW